MNAAGKLFQSSIELTEDQLLIFKTEPYFAPYFFLLGGSKLPLEKAETILDTLFESQQEDGRMALYLKGIETPFIQAPLHAGIIWQYVQEIEDKRTGRKLVKKYFEKLVHSHLYWYEHRDIEEDGLVSIFHPIESLLPTSCAWDESLNAWKKRAHSTDEDISTSLFNKQKDLLISSQQPEKEWAMKDPVVNTLLCWSNEALIAMGKFIRKNVSEIIQWNELALYSMNEELWDEEYGIYRGYDLITKELPLSGSIGGLLPLLAGIPVPEQAEARVGALRLKFEQPDFSKLASNSRYADVTQ
ncbi:MAG: MGH1-like glycoside hydrolase domain-containing protein, partial [Bacteroidota bacterium]